MDKETFDYLFEEAVGLAYSCFDEPTDDHVETVLARLLINHPWGAGHDGAITVH